MGPNPFQTLELPIDDEMDGENKRSNQRAELLAAIHGLEFLLEQVNWRTLTWNRKGGHDEGAHCLVIALDSKYVHDGISDWVYEWEVSSLQALAVIVTH
jgi:ribonuclease HI